MDSIADLEFFARLVTQGSLSALARELGVTPPAISARLSQLERRLGVKLLNRTTRRLAMTQEGELYLGTGSKLLEQVQELERMVSSSRELPRGLLKVNATFGFGRRHIVPALSEFRRQYPDVEVQLDLTDRPMNLAEFAFDVGIRFGELPDQRVVGRKLATNRRFVCASPAYLEQHGIPGLPDDLRSHRCLVLRENDTAYGTWHFTKGKRHELVKVHGTMSSNDGEATLRWALDGHGVLVRSEWDVQSYIDAGTLARVLPDWSLPSADIYAIYPERLNLSAKVRVFIDFLDAYLKRPSQVRA
ncbi:Transcriptional regulator, LysR family [Caballeronia glathei]|jgi:DNA-binding transcriptional LysR family regulator|uniref:LysR family transcriptional regulator n=1 Tax=Caballeronia glathei TaxID=60547 RepID=A0A069PWI2_9BURK|nr:LysR substrate-binding domain-containing protein [Caballeronia glathei]KDR41721.1 LysR family transcriptional regulator [Caballeronia glathei]CDY78127.1 Transcriptional regulator, LysR family [Caballeronia glathei]